MNDSPPIRRAVVGGARQDSWVRAADGWLAGVCSGLARRVTLDVWVVRFVAVISVFIFGTGVLAYLVLAVCLPREDRVERAYKPMLFGVCSRLARRADLEVGLVRVATLSLAFFTLGSALIGYLALYFLMPDPDLRPGSDAN